MEDRGEDPSDLTEEKTEEIARGFPDSQWLQSKPQRLQPVRLVPILLPVAEPPPRRRRPSGAAFSAGLTSERTGYGLEVSRSNYHLAGVHSQCNSRRCECAQKPRATLFLYVVISYSNAPRFLHSRFWNCLRYEYMYRNDHPVCEARRRASQILVHNPNNSYTLSSTVMRVPMCERDPTSLHSFPSRSTAAPLRRLVCGRRSYHARCCRNIF